MKGMDHYYIVQEGGSYEMASSEFCVCVHFVGNFQLFFSECF
jgi:hypothetical protein